MPFSILGNRNTKNQVIRNHENERQQGTCILLFFSGNFQKIINAALLQQTHSFSLAEQFVLASFCFRIVFIS